MGLHTNKQVRVDWGKKQPKFYTKDDGALKLHPGSVNALQPGALMHKCVRWRFGGKRCLWC
jgi:hypothetical protein